MKNYISTEASKHLMRLTMMGAEVKQVNSKMCYVKFKLDKCEVSYVYNINKHDRYFLERIKPYPLTYRDFAKEEDIIREIELDLKQFKNVACSHNLENFIRINRDFHFIMQEFEDLYLYYNVPEDKVDYFVDELKKIHKKIIETKNNSERVFFESEPLHLK